MALLNMHGMFKHVEEETEAAASMRRQLTIDESQI
jgi:hypothetical protein